MTYLGSFGVHQTLSCAHSHATRNLCTRDCFCSCHIVAYPFVDFLSKMLGIKSPLMPAKGRGPWSARTLAFMQEELTESGEEDFYFFDA